MTRQVQTIGGKLTDHFEDEKFHSQLQHLGVCAIHCNPIPRYSYECGIQAAKMGKPTSVGRAENEKLDDVTSF